LLTGNLTFLSKGKLNAATFMNARHILFAMSRLLCLLPLLIAPAFSRAQFEPVHPPVTPKPEDVKSQDAIIKALYDVISGPIGQKRDWDRMRSLFVADARMGAAIRTRKGDIRYIGFSVEKYIADDDKIMTEKGFFEKELRRHSDTWANMTQVFSTYESRWKPEDPKPFERGINSIQLMNDGKRWWVVSIFWQGEDDKAKLPR